MPMKYIDVDIDIDDVTEYIECANENRLETIAEAVKERSQKLKIKQRLNLPQDPSTIRFYNQTAAEQIAAAKLQEALDRHGIEWVVDHLTA